MLWGSYSLQNTFSLVFHESCSICKKEIDIYKNMETGRFIEILNNNKNLNNYLK